MIVALTGATGYVGRFIAGEVLGTGHELRAWARPQSDRGGFTGPIDWQLGHLRDARAIARLVEGADAVVHAALEHLPGRYRGGEGSDRAGFRAANLDGSLELLDAARRAGVGRFVFLSSRAVYGGPDPGHALDETWPTAPETEYGACKAAVEAAITAQAGLPGFVACALRPTGVHGLAHPARRSRWFGLVEAVLAGRGWPDARGGTEVHGRDVARAVRLLLEKPGVGGQVFNCGGFYITNREVARIAQRLSGCRGPLPGTPTVPPHHVMRSDKLKALGLRFGGRSLLVKTIGQLVVAARSC